MEEDEEQEEVASNLATSSGFSFLAQQPTSSDATQEEIKEEKQESLHHDSKERTGFSFLSSSNQTKNDVEPVLSGEAEDISQDSSGFSFLLKGEPRSGSETDVTKPHSGSISRQHEEPTLPDTILNTPETTSSVKTETHTPTPVPVSPIPTPTSTTTLPTPVPQKVGRQAPPNRKKKKHKALRPGQERNDEIYSDLVDPPTSAAMVTISNDLDGLSIDSHESSSTIDQSIAVENEKERERQRVDREDNDLPPPLPVSDNEEIRLADKRGKDQGGRSSAVIDNDTHEDNGITEEKEATSGEGVVTAGDPVIPPNNTSTEQQQQLKQEEGASDGTLVQLLNEEDEDLKPQTTEAAQSSPMGSTDHISSDLVGVFDHGAEGVASEDAMVTETGNYAVELSPTEKMATLLESAESNSKAIRYVRRCVCVSVLLEWLHDLKACVMCCI